MTNSNLRVVTPITENRTVTPLRAPNAELRTREHLTADEVEKLIEAAKANRYGYRDALMVLLAYRHGLRAAEVVDVRWKQVDFKTATLHIRRAKNGTPATHPLSGREMRELRRHQRESAQSPFVFVSERGAPLSAPGFSRLIPDMMRSKLPLTMRDSTAFTRQSAWVWPPVTTPQLILLGSLRQPIRRSIVPKRPVATAWKGRPLQAKALRSDGRATY